MPQPNNEVSEETPTALTIDQKAIERSENLLDTLFDPEGAAKKASAVEVKKPVKKEVEKVVKKDVDKDDEEAEDDPTDDDPSDDEDWDAAPKKKADEGDDDEDPPDESAARKQAKIRGREAKELKTKLTEARIETDRIAKERDDLQTRLDEVSSTKIKPEDHSDYVDMRDSILSEARTAARRMPGKSKLLLPQKFGNLMADYLASENAPAEDIIETDAKLAGSIVDALELSEIPYADLDDDERAAFQPSVDKVLDLLEKTSGKTKELQKLHTTLTAKAKVGQLSVGVRDYENTVKEFKPILDSIGDLSEDILEAHPHSVEAVVARLAKSTPEGAKRLDKARADVLEALIGPRALTQKELDKLEANAVDLKSFMVERAKAHRAKQLKLLPMFVQALMTRSHYKESLTKLSKYEQDTEAEESEFDAIHSATKKRGNAEKKKDDVRPKDRPSAINRLFPSDG